MTKRLAGFVAIQLAFCFLVMAIYWKPALDDSYIFLTYARSLAATGKFTLNPGEVSYGFSSPAYTMLLALASRLTFLPVGVLIENILGVLLCIVSSAAVWAVWEETGNAPQGRSLIPAAVLMSGPWFFTVWFLFGMEGGLAIAGLLGFLLWVAKVRNGASRWPWLLVGAASASVLALTRLEAGVYIAVWLIVLALAMRFRRLADVVVVAAVSGSVQLAWFAFAHRTFGSYMPWTSTARMIYYIPGRFGMTSAQQYQHLTLFARLWVSTQALASMLFAGPMKVLLMAVPLGVALWLLRSRFASRQSDGARWMLGVAAVGMATMLVLFALLFPLAQNRHFTPYFAGLWALAVPGVVRCVRAQAPVWRTASVAAVALLWIAGAAQYWNTGHMPDPLRALAESGQVREGDRIGAEPIGILSFESKAYIIDLGGLTERDVWPMLTAGNHAHLHQVVAWEQSKGANKILLSMAPCGRWPQFGGYCLFPAAEAHRAISTLRPDDPPADGEETH